MKCISCDKVAIVVFNGFSLCDEHLQKAKQDLERASKIGANIIKQVQERMGIQPTQNFEVKV